MNQSTSSRNGFTIAIIALASLSGCAFVAPGYNGAAVNAPISREVDENGAWTSTNTKTKPAIININPETIKILQEINGKSETTDLSPLIGKSEPYTIGTGDVVSIVVYDHPELMPSSGAVVSQSVDPTGISAAPGLIVNSNGEISYPYIGRIKLSGLTEVQASELVISKLSEFIQSPQVTVRIQSFRSRRVYVEGEVRIPGMQVITDQPMTVMEALNRAGGINANGDRSNIVVIRNGKSYGLNLPDLNKANFNLENLLLKSGDSIYVKNRDDKKIYLTGEILRPSALLMRDGQLSLAQALGEAGGVNLNTANPAQIFVIRKQVDGTPFLFHLNAENPAQLAVADSFQLQPRDVIYVDPVPLVRWNRIINLILPSAAALNYGSQIDSRQ